MWWVCNRAYYMQAVTGVAPCMDLDVPLSAYAVVFYKHAFGGSGAGSGEGAFKTVLKTTCMRDSDLWDLLKDWSLLLMCFARSMRSTAHWGECVRHLGHTFHHLFHSVGYI